ncbi:MAG TPA: hypothetical protein VLW45_05060 [Pelomicrobium sp.]|nr:hypothetical protein [Pelomicrobium sp.]
MTDFVDIYCERIGPGLWAEPINLLTNAAFLLAAATAAARFARAPGLTPRSAWDIALLIALLAAIGIGSALWHAFAQPWAGLADTIPILLFINVFLPSFLYRVARLGALPIVVLFVLFQAANFGVRGAFPPDALNGSIFYAPAWLGLGLMALFAGVRRHPAAAQVGMAWVVFTVSLAFRTMDAAVCAAVPVGTHFLWHLLNAIVLYLLVDALMRASPHPRPAR